MLHSSKASQNKHIGEYIKDENGKEVSIFKKGNNVHFTLERNYG